MINTICFDLFFTLVKPCYSSNELENEYSVLGLTQNQWEHYAEDETLYEARALGQVNNSEEIVALILCRLDRAVDTSILKQVTDLRESRFKRTLIHVEHEILDTLGLLKNNGYKLCLISNADVIDKKYWEQSPLAPFFDHVIFSCDVASLKPNQLIYEIALERMATSACQCVFVGDGGSNELYGAKTIGMTCVMTEHFLRRDKEARENILSHADFAIGHILELPPLLELLQTENEGE